MVWKKCFQGNNTFEFLWLRCNLRLLKVPVNVLLEFIYRSLNVFQQFPGIILTTYICFCLFRLKFYGRTRINKCFLNKTFKNITFFWKNSELGKQIFLWRHSQGVLNTHLPCYLCSVGYPEHISDTFQAIRLCPLDATEEKSRRNLAIWTRTNNTAGLVLLRGPSWAARNLICVCSPENIEQDLGLMHLFTFTNEMLRTYCVFC